VGIGAPVEHLATASRMHRFNSTILSGKHTDLKLRFSTREILQKLHFKPEQEISSAENSALLSGGVKKFLS